MQNDSYDFQTLLG